MCTSVFTKRSYLVNHYMESHYSRMPKGIFGEPVKFKCYICEITFKKNKNLVKKI